MKNKKNIVLPISSLLMTTMLVPNVSYARFGAAYYDKYVENGGFDIKNSKTILSTFGAQTVEEMAKVLLFGKYIEPNKEIKPGDTTVYQEVEEQNSGSNVKYTLTREGFVYRDGIQIEGLHDITKIAVGSAASAKGGTAHLIALKNDGTVWAVGNNTTGQLGIGWEESRELNQPVSYNSNYEYKWPCEKCAPNATLNPTSDTNEHYNEYAQRNNNNSTTTTRNKSTRMTRDITDDIKAKSTVKPKRFDYHSEQCGTVVNKPTQVKNISNAIDIATTFYSSAIATKEGDVYTFGSSRNYELGVGMVSFNDYDYDTFCSYEAIQTNLKNVTKLGGDTFTFLAETKNGAQYVWGAIDSTGYGKNRAETPMLIKEGSNEIPEQDIEQDVNESTEIDDNNSNGTVDNNIQIVESKANVKVKLKNRKKSSFLRLIIKNEIETLIGPDEEEIDLFFNKRGKAKLDYKIEKSGQYEFIIKDYEKDNKIGCSKIIVDVDLKAKEMDVEIVELDEEELEDYIY